VRTVPPISKLLISMADLLPTAEELMVVAYESMAGDGATAPEGRHGGRDPDRLDMQDLSKRMVYQRAQANDTAWFDAVAAAVRADPHAWAPSLRTLVPKGKSNDTRPIDDPSEIKRLVALVARAKLKQKLIARFTEGQVGSRPGKFCTRKGATAQDQLAAAILLSIRAGYTWCVLIDLRDAFGRVPELLALREFGRMGLDPGAAKFLWRLVRIYAVTDRTKAPAERDKMGIEQGNPLSAYVMDLVLAPAMRRVEARHQVQAFSYLDDIYIMCRTEQEAEAAYQAFRSIAEGLGVDNVRDLWGQGGRAPKGKNSIIVDSSTNHIRVLKTYDIDLLGVSAAPQKEMDYRLDLKADGQKFARMTICQARKALHCQALTAEATRARNNILMRLPSSSGGHPQSPSGAECPSSPSRGITRMTMTLGFNTPKGTVTDEVQQPFGHKQKDVVRTENPVEEPMSFRTEVNFNGAFSQSKHIEDDRKGGANHLHVLPDDDDKLVPLLADREVESTCPLVDDAEATLPPGGSGLSGDGEADVGLPPSGCDGLHDGDDHLLLLEDKSCACSSQHNQAGSVSLPGGSSRSEGPCKPRGHGRADDGGRPAAHYLSLDDPAVQAALAAGLGFKLGDAYKGAVVDLTGLGVVVLDRHRLPEVVNGLVKTARTRRMAKVIIDPAEPWTATPTLLGKVDDQAYERLTAENLPDGKMLLTLRQRARKASSTKTAPTTPPVGVDSVLAVRCINRAAGTCELCVVEVGVRHVRAVAVTSASGVGGAVEAVAAWAASRGGRDVALPAKGQMGAVVSMLVQGECWSPNIDFGDGVRRLLAGRVWTLAGDSDWACGRCCTAPRPAGRASPHGTGGR
jgi:hypothetical protein